MATDPGAPLVCAIAPVEAIVQLAIKLPVFPCRRTPEEILVRGEKKLAKAKSPLNPHGFLEASQDPNRIRAWWNRFPESLVGVPTGKLTRLIVIDYDEYKADEPSREWFMAHALELASTRVHSTLSGGRHYVFRAPEGQEYRSGVGVFLQGAQRNAIDIRAEGGYIIYWPLHGGSVTGDLAPLPAGLIDERKIEARDLQPLPTVTPLKWSRDRRTLVDLLPFLDPADYDLWMRAGMAISLASAGSDDGFTLWHDWSSGEITGECPSNYSGVNDCRYRWASYKHQGGRKNMVTIGSLVVAAEARGYVKPKREVPHQQYNEVPREQGASFEQALWQLLEKTAPLWGKILPEVPRGLYAQMAQIASSAGITEVERQLQELCERLSASGETHTAVLREMLRSQLADASRELFTAARSAMALSEMSSGASQNVPRLTLSTGYPQSRGTEAPLEELPPVEVYAGSSASPSNAVTAIRPLPVADEMPIIECRAGEISRMVMEAQDAILAQSGQIYQRSGLLARIARLDRDVEFDGITRPAGSAIIVPVAKDFMALTLSRVASWVKYDGRKKGLRRIDPPSAVASTLLSMAGEWRVPVLTGLVTAPTLRADGSLLDKPGYDAASGLFGAFDPNDFPNINSTPSAEEAHEALRLLDDLFSEFVYLRSPGESAPAPSAHSSVAIAALLTAAVRMAIPTAPATGIDAAKQGSGKTTLAKVICTVVTGHDPPVLTLATDEAEFKKCLLAILMAGDACVLIDNVDKPVDSASLCAVLTSSTYSERVLGVNQRLTVPSTVTWLITGNHLEFVGDLTSRVMLTVLDPQEERPESREFDRNVIDYAREHRGELLAAALTISLAYRTAGRPPGTHSPSRFPEWDLLVRRPLLWLERPDPLATQESVRDVDPVREGLIGVLSAWRTIFGTDPGTVKEIINRTTGPQSLYPDALEALQTVAGNRDGTINSRRLGKYLARSVRRIEAGMRLIDAGPDPQTTRRRFAVTTL